MKLGFVLMFLALTMLVAASRRGHLHNHEAYSEDDAEVSHDVDVGCCGRKGGQICKVLGVPKCCKQCSPWW